MTAMEYDINEPTPDQCSNHEKVFEDDHQVGYAIWYPQMSGYVGKAVVVFPKSENCWDKCFDALVWHDGDFPFKDDHPREVHHCDPDQFIDFGKTVLSMQRKHAD